jgi:hypothetical protein
MNRINLGSYIAIENEVDGIDVLFVNCFLKSKMVQGDFLMSW